MQRTVFLNRLCLVGHMPLLAGGWRLIPAYNQAGQRIGWGIYRPSYGVLAYLTRYDLYAPRAIPLLLRVDNPN